MKNLRNSTMVIVFLIMAMVAISFPLVYWPRADRTYVRAIQNFDKENTVFISWSFPEQQPTKIVLWLKAPVNGTHDFPINIKGINKVELSNASNIAGFNFIFEGEIYLGLNGSAGYQLNGVKEALPLDCRECGYKFIITCLNLTYHKSVSGISNKLIQPDNQLQDNNSNWKTLPDNDDAEQALPTPSVPAVVNNNYINSPPPPPNDGYYPPPAKPRDKKVVLKGDLGLHNTNEKPFKSEITGPKGGPIEAKNKLAGDSTDQTPVPFKGKISGDSTDQTPVPLDTNVSGQVKVNTDLTWIVVAMFAIAFAIIVLAWVISRKKKVPPSSPSNPPSQS